MMKTLKLEFLEKYGDVGLLLMRIGLGASFIVHGWPKISGGPAQWEQLGSRLEAVAGIGFLPEFWGFMAAFAEFGGGI
ncbi:MAG: DoxX family protein, partial [Persicimonas sp.]